MIITSRNNGAVKEIRALRQRKAREQSGLFWAEGIRIVAEAIQLGVGLETLVVAPDLLSSDFARELVAAQGRAGASILEVSGDVFASLSAKDGPQGLGAVLRQRWEPLAAVRLAAGLGWVALHAVQDPGNLGTILRTGDAVGASGVILIDDCADPYDPATARASMGALFSQRLARATWAEFLDWKAQAGAFVAGTSGAAPRQHHAVAYPQPLVLLMGSERAGLAPAQQAACDLTVAIPMVGRSDSLNLAAATSVMLYEIFLQGRRSAAS